MKGVVLYLKWAPQGFWLQHLDGSEIVGITRVRSLQRQSEYYRVEVLCDPLRLPREFTSVDKAKTALLEAYKAHAKTVYGDDVRIEVVA